MCSCTYAYQLPAHPQARGRCHSFGPLSPLSSSATLHARRHDVPALRRAHAQERNLEVAVAGVVVLRVLPADGVRTCGLTTSSQRRSRRRVGARSDRPWVQHARPRHDCGTVGTTSIDAVRSVLLRRRQHCTPFLAAHPTHACSFVLIMIGLYFAFSTNSYATGAFTNPWGMASVQQVGRGPHFL